MHSKPATVLSLILLLTPASTKNIDAQQTNSRAAGHKPVSMIECQGINNCATWTFVNARGTGKWPTGEEAVLEVTRLQGKEITILRTDIEGPQRGMSSTYSGTFDGDQVGGSFESTTSEGKTSRGHWYWITGDTPISLPKTIHFCDSNCMTLILEDGHYRNISKYSWDTPDSLDIWTVVSFTADSIILSRHAWANGKTAFTALYKGRLSADREHMVFDPDPKVRDVLMMSWGSALDSVPANNGERDRRVAEGRPVTLGDALQAANTLKNAIELYQFFSALFSPN